MKRVLLIVFIMSGFLSARGQEADSLSFISLKPAEFLEELETVPNPMIIDVRELFEYKKSRLKGAINIPASGSIDVQADTINRATHLFLYCTSGFRSRRVAQKFAERGFIHIYSLDGGITEWKKEGFPVDRKKLRRKG